MQNASTENWHVYIVLCADDTLYTGIAKDLDARLRAHADGRGAKYLRGRLPITLVYTEFGHDKVSASQREAVIKRLPRRAKIELIERARHANSHPRD